MYLVCFSPPHIFGSSLLYSARSVFPSSGNTFAVLVSTNIYGKPIGGELKRSILSTYNARPDNIHGELIRFLILDNGYKEGLDVFDVKYLHILEPQLTPNAETQVVGRGTRFCGQKGLDFLPGRGWPLHVFRYDVSLENKGYDAATMGDLFLSRIKTDIRQLTLAAEFETHTNASSCQVVG